MAIFKGFSNDFKYLKAAQNNSLVVVEWIENDHFADNGDCGSIYYYKYDGWNIPFAVHVSSARLNEKKYSFGAKLDFDETFNDIVINFKVSPNCQRYLEYNLTDELEVGTFEITL